jgi:uncharacterized protein (TIGR03083 family)
MESDPRAWIAALRHSHDRLVQLVQPMTADQRRAQSYCRDWTIAQVLSHLGSGAEIALMMLPGALGRSEHVDRDEFQPVWDRWNAKNPDDQAQDALAVDAEHVQMLEGLSDEDLAAIRFPFFGMDLDAVGLIRLRLGEHALHTWDVAVTEDPAAVVSPDAVSLLIDNVPQFLAPRLGKPQEQPVRARIRTSQPDRDYLLTAGESVTMTDWADAGSDSAGDGAGVGGAGGAGGGAVAEIAMPAEALLRLSYGRLDSAHTPASVVGSLADLDRLRAIFPGF